MSSPGFLLSNEYNRLHKERLRHYPKVGVCTLCDIPSKTQWANKSGEYRSAFDEFDWLELCPKCHSFYDHIGVEKRGYASVEKTVLNRTEVRKLFPRKDYPKIVIDKKREGYKRLNTYVWAQ